MEVSKRIFIKFEDLDDTPICDGHRVVMSVNTIYASKNKSDLIQEYSSLVSSDTFGKFYRRISRDNGRTWSGPVPVHEPAREKAGVLRMGESALLFDSRKGKIINFYNFGLYPENSFSASVRRYNRIFLRISGDGGLTFSEAFPLVQKGYDSENWAEGVVYGRNKIGISFCVPVQLPGGKIILPVSRSPLDADLKEKYLVPLEAGCFIGTWKGDLLEWELGRMVKTSPERSSRGLCEPAIAELADGTLLMVMRGSNAGLSNVPGYKWQCISDDGGYSWSNPEPWFFESGERFYSPATGSRLIRSSKNRKLYWIGNIVKENPDGNRPRYPLIMAEVDEDRRALKKNSMGVIDDRGEKDSEFVQLSNFRVYEDRRTNEFVLHMARIQEISMEDRSSSSMEYRINFLGA